MPSKPYRSTKDATPFDRLGRLVCDRCGRNVQPWPIVRPDNCGPGVGYCIRTYAAVIKSWQRYGYLGGEARITHDRPVQHA